MDDLELYRQQDGNFYFIYKVTNNINKKYYIGQHRTKNINDGYMGSGKRIKAAYKKYGKVNFTKEYLYFLNDKISLYTKEKEIITEELLKDPLCYNVVPGGGGSVGNTTNAITKMKWLKENDPNWIKNKNESISIALKEKYKDPNYRKKISDGAKRRILENGHHRLGKKMSLETKEKISKANKNRKKKELNLDNFEII